MVNVTAQGTSRLAMLVLKDVLWVPGLPCPLMSTGAFRREGGEFADCGAQASYIRISITRLGSTSLGRNRCGHRRAVRKRAKKTRS